MKHVHEETLAWLNEGNRPIFPESLILWQIPVVPGIRLRRWTDLAIHKSISARDEHSGYCDHPLFRGIVADTFGYFASAEQVEQALSLFSGLTGDQANFCRREFAKRKAVYMKTESPKLIDRAMAYHGMSKADAAGLLDLFFEIANSWRQEILNNIAWHTYVAAYFLTIQKNKHSKNAVIELSADSAQKPTNLEGKPHFISITSRINISVFMVETLSQVYFAPDYYLNEPTKTLD